VELLVIGFDGLSYNMLDEFDVETPFLDSVRAGGISGDLQSIDTPTTLPAWTSFATGKDPGSHGVATMLKQSSDYSISPASVNTTDAAIYDFLDDSVFVNLPGSVGRKPAAGGTHLVSSILSSGPSDAVPKSMQSLDAFDDYVVHDDGSLKSDPEAYVEHLSEEVCARHGFAVEAFDREEPRVGFVLFSTPDWVGHFLQYAPDETTGGRWYRSVVELCDDRAADIAEKAENVLCLSDHGFEHKPKAVHLQSWLEREGYLQKASQRSPIQRVATGTAKQVARRFDTVFDILRTVYLRFNNDGEGGLGNVIDFNPDVDFAASRAWQLRYGCLYVNDERYESPVVDNPEEFREELREQLASLTDDDGMDVFEWVGFPEDAYADPDPGAMLPDIIARPAPGYLPLRAFSPTGDPVISKPGHEHYDHRYRGIVAATGPLFESGIAEGMSIVDVVPTLLYALGEPLQPDFDGEIRQDLVTVDVEPTTLDTADIPAPQIRAGNVDREEAAREQLRQLGYLE
jgi:predicted AlkP superfamily phosphohydrolase/phosphomutase